MAGHFEFAYMLDGSNKTPDKRQLPVAASQTLVAGDLLVVSSNQLVKASASVAAPAAVCLQTSTTQAAATLIDVAIIVPGQVWHAVASADASSVVLGAGLYDITSGQKVDIADSSGGAILIVEYRLSVTDVYVTFTKGFFWT